MRKQHPEPDLTTHIGAKLLVHPVMLGAGPYKEDWRGLHELARLSITSAICVGSVTLHPQKGNLEPTFSAQGSFALNSVALRNSGWERYRNFVSFLEVYRKPIILNIAAYSCEEFIRFFKELARSGFSGPIELNLSCPNTDFPVIGHNIALTRHVLHNARQILGENRILGVKLQYTPSTDFIEFMARALTDTRMNFVVLGNTLPAFACDVKTAKPVLANSGAALSGSALKPFNLWLVRRYHEHLQNSAMQIVGSGGVQSGRDAFEYLAAGADAVQVTTAFLEKGPQIFDKIHKELVRIMKRNKVYSIGELHRKFSLI